MNEAAESPQLTSIEIMEYIYLNNGTELTATSFGAKSLYLGSTYKHTQALSFKT